MNRLIKTIAFAGMIIFLSCHINRNLGEFSTMTPYGVIELFRDSTYKADYKMAGRSYGTWNVVGDTLILNSQYRDCCIDSVEIHLSESDTSIYSVINLKTFDNQSYNLAGIILRSNYGNDSIWIFGGELIIDKSKGYTSFILARPLGINAIAVAAPVITDFRDTVTIYLDYVQDVKNFRFYNNNHFLIDRKRKTVCPLNQ